VVFSGYSGFLHQLNYPHDITEILLKMALNAINQTQPGNKGLFYKVHSILKCYVFYSHASARPLNT
jgi:hypothetical protein